MDPDMKNCMILRIHVEKKFLAMPSGTSIPTSGWWLPINQRLCQSAVLLNSQAETYHWATGCSVSWLCCPSHQTKYSHGTMLLLSEDDCQLKYSKKGIDSKIVIELFCYFFRCNFDIVSAWQNKKLVLGQKIVEVFIARVTSIRKINFLN